jgi:hypothetical protein
MFIKKKKDEEINNMISSKLDEIIEIKEDNKNEIMK